MVVDPDTAAYLRNLAHVSIQLGRVTLTAMDKAVRQSRATRDIPWSRMHVVSRALLSSHVAVQAVLNTPNTF